MEGLFKVAIYIIGVVIYLLIKVLTKKKPEQHTQNPNQMGHKKPLPHTIPTKSFADSPPKKTAPSMQEAIKKLEKEIKVSQKIIKPEKHIKSGKVYGKDESTYQRENLEERSRSSEVKSKDVQDHFNKIQSYNEIKDYETDYKGEEPLFEYPADESKKPNPYAELLKNSDGARQAFILKEILDRKY